MHSNDSWKNNRRDSSSWSNGNRGDSWGDSWSKNVMPHKTVNSRFVYICITCEDQNNLKNKANHNQVYSGKKIETIKNNNTTQKSQTNGRKKCKHL